MSNTSISLPFITATAEGPKHIDTTLTRAKFEALSSDLLERCRIPVEQALKVRCNIMFETDIECLQRCFIHVCQPFLQHGSAELF